MGLFKRGRSSAKTSRVEAEASKAWAVLRLFQAKEPPASSNRQASLLKHDTFSASNSSFEAAAAATANNEGDNCGNHRKSRRVLLGLSNQNYTPEVALSAMSHQRLVPTVMPLCRLEATHNESGSISTDEKERALARFQLWQQRRPRFHFGPRDPAGGDDASVRGDRRGSVSAGSTAEATGETDKILALPPKYAFIYQDGKFVEREVNHWPKMQRAQLHTRYRVLEPYASQYGRRYKRRIDNEERVVSQRHRLIYQNPIYRLPRRVMEENKFRLMTRHSLKDSFEGGKPIGGPQKIEVGEREQTRMIKKMQEKSHRKEAEKLVTHMVAKKGKS